MRDRGRSWSGLLLLVAALMAAAVLIVFTCKGAMPPLPGAQPATQVRTEPETASGERTNRVRREDGGDPAAAEDVLRTIVRFEPPADGVAWILAIDRRGEPTERLEGTGGGVIQPAPRLPTGCELRLEAEDHVPVSRMLHGRYHEIGEVALVLRRYASVRCTVRDASGPVEGAIASLVHVASRRRAAGPLLEEQRVRTDAAGRSPSLRVTPESRTVLEVRHPRFGPEVRELPEQPPGAAIEVDVELREGVVLVGRVVDDVERPMVGVRVHAATRSKRGRSEVREYDCWVTTDASGGFRTPALDDADGYVLTVAVVRDGEHIEIVNELDARPPGEHDVGTLRPLPNRTELVLTGLPADVAPESVSILLSSFSRDGRSSFGAGSHAFGADGRLVVFGLHDGMLRYSLEQATDDVPQRVGHGEIPETGPVVEIPWAPPPPRVFTELPPVRVESATGDPVDVALLRDGAVVRVASGVASGELVPWSRGVEVAEYEIWVRSGDRFGRVPVATGGDAEVAARPASAGRRLELRVTLGGEPVVNGLVRVNAIGGTRSGHGLDVARTDDAGHCVITGLPVPAEDLVVTVRTATGGRGIRVAADHEGVVELEIE